jgi:hypothetical protein
LKVGALARVFGFEGSDAFRNSKGPPETRFHIQNEIRSCPNTDKRTFLINPGGAQSMSMIKKFLVGAAAATLMSGAAQAG